MRELFNIAPIITSRWASDAYKASMGYVFHTSPYFKGLHARYCLTDRLKTPLPKGFLDEYRRQLEYMANLPAGMHIAEYMAEQWPFIPKSYWYWYANFFQFKLEYVHIEEKDGNARIWFEGPLDEVTHWELPAIRIYCELLNIFLGRKPAKGWNDLARSRAKLFKETGIVWAFMGGRRSFSADVLEDVIGIACDYAQEYPDGPGLSGISWMEKAYQHGKRPMGSVAHEYYQICAARFGYKNANRMAMQIWSDTYGDNLGYALTDTFTTNSFLQDLSFAYANLFSAFRQDSGDPFAYADAVLEHLKRLGIDPTTKLIVHTNIRVGEEHIVLGLNEHHWKAYKHRFGMGSIFDNNCGWPSANAVCKNDAIILPDGTEIRTVKISDEPGKECGDPVEIAKCKATLGIKR